MSGEKQVNDSGSSVESGPSAVFITYCEAEFERRRNSDQPFDEAVYRDAMELTLRKIRALEEEGYA